MQLHHQVNSKVNAIRCEEVSEEFVTYLNFHLSQIAGVKSFLIFHLKRGMLFKKKVLTLAFVFDTTKEKNAAMQSVGAIITGYYKDRKDFIDLIPLSLDNKAEKQLYDGIVSCNAHSWKL